MRGTNPSEKEDAPGSYGRSGEGENAKEPLKDKIDFGQRGLNGDA